MAPITVPAFAEPDFVITEVGAEPGGAIDNISIDTVRGQQNHYENVRNLHEMNVHIRTFIEEAEKEIWNK